MFFLLSLSCYIFTGIDLVGPLRENNGMKYIVTSVCYFTKWVEAKVIPNKTGFEVVKFIYHSIFCRFGCVDICISDQDKCNL